MPQDKLVILLPVYDDWDALGALLERIARVLSQAGLRATVVVLDDASTTPPDFAWPDDPALAGGRLVALRRNLGHQRAIAIGLAYVHESFPGASTVVMDADGEDDPADIPRLLAACAQAGGRRIVFAERWRRSERLVFQLFYQLYRGAHWVLTGIPVKVGNFSVVPFACLERLVVVSELWSHYAAAVFKAKIPYLSVPTARARRIAGESKMRFVGLVVHGLTAIAVFSDVVGVRLLIASSILLALSLGALVAAPSYLSAAQTVPSLAVALAAGLFIVLQATAIAAVFVFVILAGRQSMAFLPIRDHAYFVRGVTELPMEEGKGPRLSAIAADYRYEGSELDLFALAENWKRYLRAQMEPYFGAEVLEVGAGMGATTRALYGGGVRRWTCLEPDAELAGRIDLAGLPACEVRQGTVADLDAGERFDAVLYVDVLEHIDDDRAELAAATRHLRGGGRIIVLAPAHAFLFTAFDERIGHRRRYTRSTLTAAAPPELRLERCRYLDSVGMLASLGNRLLLRSAMPSRGQILLWDRWMTTLSRRLDPLTGWRLGKSVLGIWQK